MDTVTDKVMYTPAEVADRCQVSLKMVQEWINSGELPSYKLSERSVRVSKAALDRFLEGRSQKPATGQKRAYSDDFEAFWKRYWRKVQKKAAWLVWQRLQRDGVLPPLDVLLKAIHAQEAVYGERELRYVPHPRTWLNQHRWADDPKAVEGEGKRSISSLEDLSPWERAALLNEEETKFEEID